MVEVQTRGRWGSLTPWWGLSWAALSGEVLGPHGEVGEMCISREGFVDHPREWRCEMSSHSGCAGTGGELPHIGSAARSVLPCPSNHLLLSLCFNFSVS